ncbi:hypothetical protein BC937DRAFT_94042 [Endogone sp. FLAS-F59071]|nr:hypothetical protein BC937DRAFT_94042 [Endogone sp. FLAS-F59071]|eukprot:RUS14296.1 hypothetical protein BC937DRAFT_94042 [Endogone sp. FLAS-F59071]
MADTPPFHRLSNEVLLNIFIHIDSPRFFLRTCHRFHSLATDPHIQARWFLHRFGRHLAFFYAARHYPRMLNARLAQSLEGAGALISRFYVQTLGQKYEGFDDIYPNQQDRPYLTLHHHRAQQKDYNRHLPLSGVNYIMQRAYEYWGEELYTDGQDDYTLWQIYAGDRPYNSTLNSSIPSNPTSLCKLLTDYRFYPLPVHPVSWTIGQTFLAMAVEHPDVLALTKPIFRAEEWIQNHTFQALFPSLNGFPPRTYTPPQLALAMTRLDFAFDERRVRNLFRCCNVDAVQQFLAASHHLGLSFSLRPLAQETILANEFDNERTSLLHWSVSHTLYHAYPCPDLLLNHIAPYLIPATGADPPNAQPPPRLLSSWACNFVVQALGTGHPTVQRVFDVMLLKVAGHPSTQSSQAAMPASWGYTQHQVLEEWRAAGHRLKPKHVRYVTGSRHKRFLAKFFNWVDETMQKAREGGEEGEESNGDTDGGRKEREGQKEQEDVKVWVWFEALDEAWFEEERKREARGRKTKSHFQTALESFLGMGSG